MRVESAPANPLYRNLAFVPWGERPAHRGSTAVANPAAVARGRRHGAPCWWPRASSGCAGESDQREQGVISHTGAGRKATFGELAGSAAKQSVPTQVKLKTWRFHYRRNQKLPRLDARAKSTANSSLRSTSCCRDDDCVSSATALRAKVSSFDAARPRPSPAWSTCADTARRGGRGRDMWSPRRPRGAECDMDESGARNAARRAHEGVPDARARQGAVTSCRWATSKRHWRMRPSAGGEFEFPYLAHAPMER